VLGHGELVPLVHQSGFFPPWDQHSRVQYTIAHQSKIQNSLLSLYHFTVIVLVHSYCTGSESSALLLLFQKQCTHPSRPLCPSLPPSCAPETKAAMTQRQPGGGPPGARTGGLTSELGCHCKHSVLSL